MPFGSRPVVFQGHGVDVPSSLSEPQGLKLLGISSTLAGLVDESDEEPPAELFPPASMSTHSQMPACFLAIVGSIAFGTGLVACALRVQKPVATDSVATPKLLLGDTS